MKILIVSHDYPHKREVRFPFVKQLVDEFSRQGHECCVLSPYNVLHNRHIFTKSESEMYPEIHLVRPNYLSFGPHKLFGFSPSSYFDKKAHKRGLKKIPFVPDVIYCHFWASALFVYDYAKQHGIPLFVASGESAIKTSHKIPSGFTDYVSGAICVSSKNRDESVNMGLVTEDKCIVIPNAVNSGLFKRMDKSECRKRLNVPDGAFVVSFVGWFDERKGSKRVEQALHDMSDSSTYAFFIGSGPLEPECNNILFKGRLKHEEIPVYLNASDIFVLPTLREGCCNAVVEAMACGLPVVSSNLPFNWDVLNENNSIMIDPNDVNDIRRAIVRLRDDNTLRQNMSKNALKDAEDLNIEKRAKAIIEFMKQRIS